MKAGCRKKGIHDRQGSGVVRNEPSPGDHYIAVNGQYSSRKILRDVVLKPFGQGLPAISAVLSRFLQG